MEENFLYDLHRSLDDLRPAYTYDMSCQKTVPPAILAFLEGHDFEEVIRLAVSLGGDSDTIAAMAGGIAQAFYGVPRKLATYCYALLTPPLRTILDNFEEMLGCHESDPFCLERFVEAQETNGKYQQALVELEHGHKTTHWIWYVFPQLKGLGHSAYAQYYGIADADEASAYLAHPLLDSRLREAAHAVLTHGGKDIEAVMGGHIDTLKLRSSMTLFDAVCPNDVFGKVLDTFYKGNKDELTIERMKKR